jgi:ribose transport system permease protein
VNLLTVISQRMSRHRRLVGWAQRNGLFFALIVLLVIFSIASDNFLTWPNMQVILLTVSVIGLMAVPGAMLILAGYVDLSVGSVAALAAIVFGQAVGVAHLPWPVGFVIGLGAGLAWGLFSGMIISYFGLSAIVVTLGGLAGARGVAELIGKGITINGFGAAFDAIGGSTFLDLPVPVWILAAAFLVGAYVWYVAPYGRHLTAIGANAEAARSLGINTRRIPLVLYTASGGAAALGGLIMTSQLDASSLTIGLGMELSVLTAILVGGVSFVGGRGSLFGVAVGVLFIGVLQNGLVLMNINPFISDTAIGAALVFAAALDVLYRRLDRIPVTDPAQQREPDASLQPEARLKSVSQRHR